MSDAVTPPFELPQPEILWFIIPLSFQVILLHPATPSSISRPLRLALTPIALYYAWFSSISHGFEPRASTVGLNFVVGVCSSYYIWKALEWGTASDLTRYTWVGFEEVDSDIGEKAAAPQKTKEQLEAMRKKSGEEDSALDIIRWSILLLLSMRGNGWAFGPPPRALAAAPPRQSIPFLKHNLLQIAWSHCALVTCAVILLARQPSRMAFYSTLFPSAKDGTLLYLSEATATLGLGLGAFSGLTLGSELAALTVFVPTQILRRLPLPEAVKPPPFDSRQYPPLFLRPWSPESVSHFWSQQWHSYFSLCFAYLGFQPFSALGEKLGGKQGGRILGVLAVFAMSSWLHEHAIWSATHTLSLPPQEDFATRWGGSIFFMSQGAGVIAEGAFKAASGRKVRGPLARVWALCVMCGLGYFVYRAWTSAGLLNNLPHPSDWSLARWLVPLACVSPPQVWT